MQSRFPTRVSRILGLGGLAADGVLRITRGEGFSVVCGDEREHERLQGFCRRLCDHLASLGLRLEELSPEELTALLRQWTEGDDACAS